MVHAKKLPTQSTRRLQLLIWIGLTVVYAGLAYLCASLAIDLGSLWAYAATLIFVVLAVHALVLAVKRTR